MKENFGFIERADVVKEIFFHFSEAKSMKEELRLGDDVEFIIQTRNVSKKKYLFDNLINRKFEI
jgi:cold shock CspA family protein